MPRESPPLDRILSQFNQVNAAMSYLLITLIEYNSRYNDWVMGWVTAGSCLDSPEEQ